MGNEFLEQVEKSNQRINDLNKWQSNISEINQTLQEQINHLRATALATIPEIVTLDKLLPDVYMRMDNLLALAFAEGFKQGWECKTARDILGEK